MIILRQKNYSSPVAKILYRVGKVKNKLTTLPARLQRDLHSGGLYKDLNRRHLADSRVKEGTKSQIQLKREAIRDNNKLRTSVMEAANASTTKRGISEYAGKKAGDFVEALAERPVGTAVTAGMYGAPAFGIFPPPGIATTTLAIEDRVLKSNKNNVYKKITGVTGRFAKRRHWKEKTGGAVKSVLNQVL